jgi:hypothetical protein
MAMMADGSEGFTQGYSSGGMNGYILAVMEIPVVEWKPTMTTL